MDTKTKEMKAKEPDFWTCKYGYFAGGCRCRLRGGDNLCNVELGGACPDYEEDEL